MSLFKRKKANKKGKALQKEITAPESQKTELAHTPEVTHTSTETSAVIQEKEMPLHDADAVGIAPASEKAQQCVAITTTADDAEESVVEESGPEFCVPNQQWEALYEAVAGLSHRDANPPLPCQDAATAATHSRPWAIVADGAGSSAVSEIGSQAVVTGLSRLATTLEKQIGALLDSAEQPTEEAGRNLGLLFVKHAKGILDDLAAVHRRPQKDFRCTLLMAIQGQNHLLWVKIGDGALVVEQLRQEDGQLHPELRTLGEVGKGEFANQTTFIDDYLQPSDVQVGLVPSQQLTGFAAMSDGAADRLVANDGLTVSSQVSSWLHDLRQGKLKRRALTRLFYSDAFTKGTTGDDASIALVASAFNVPS